MLVEVHLWLCLIILCNFQILITNLEALPIHARELIHESFKLLIVHQWLQDVALDRHKLLLNNVLKLLALRHLIDVLHVRNHSV